MRAPAASPSNVSLPTNCFDDVDDEECLRHVFLFVLLHDETSRADSMEVKDFRLYVVSGCMSTCIRGRCELSAVDIERR